MSTIEEHYAAPGLLDRIRSGLEAAGKSVEGLDVDDLAPVDELHVLGSVATDELIDLLDVPAGARVLDVGSGIGGPARRLALATGARVTGVDLSADFCATGRELNRWLGLDDRVRLETADATRLDLFDDATFDAAWSIHVGMNVPDKPALYREIARLLVPCGRFVLFDILSSGRGEIDFPVPWAATEETSFLATAHEMFAHLDEAGFAVVESRDRSTEAVAFLDESLARARAAGAPPPLGLHLVIGPEFREIMARVRRHLAEGRLAPTVFHARKR